MNARQRRVRLRHNARCPRGYIGPKYGDWRVHYKRAINAPPDFSSLGAPEQAREMHEAMERWHALGMRVCPSVY